MFMTTYAFLIAENRVSTDKFFVQSDLDNFFFNWDSLHARLKSHYKAWNYQEKKHKKHIRNLLRKNLKLKGIC